MDREAVTSHPTVSPVPRRSSLALGLDAMRANLLPGIVLWIAAVLVLIAWFAVPTAHDVLVRIAHVKERYGFGYSMISTSLFAGAIPFFLQRLVKSSGQRRDLPMLIFLVVFWALKGLEVDSFYQLQSLIFGAGNSPFTVIQKLLVDQIIYSPLWAIPTVTLATEWAQRGFTQSPWPRGRRFGHWYARDVLPVLISNACIAIPAIAVVYIMPPPLQIPIQNIVICLFVILLLCLTSHDKPTDPAAGA